MNDLAVTIHGVNKAYGKVHAVRDLDLQVPRGTLVGFLGPNGAGKSTTIRMIMSIIYPDSGSIQVLDSTALEAKDRIGYLPEERGLYRKMKINQFLTYIAKLKEVDRSDINRRINWWLERLELPDVLNRRCEALSKGQQQKLQFIASVVHDPELIILDEPFSGLDPVNASLLSNIIQELREQGRTIIFSTHVLHQAERLCDRVFLINQGVKLLDDPIEEIRDRYNPRVIAMELLEPAEGEIMRVDGVREVKSSGEGTKFDLHLNHDADAHTIMNAITTRHRLRAIEIRKPTLDDIFVELVQGASDS
ncbi:MAG: ATP-binding cassette domain-containing protein [Phycisphaerales bacterium]|nr:ATP-binding cassette domain-containing protein [Phycisphaerales bacterium]